MKPVQQIRHSVQILVLTSIFLTAIFSAFALNHYFKAVGVYQKVHSSIMGNTWAAEWFGIPFLDPLGGFESIFASQSAPASLLLGLLLPVSLTLLLGRFFCSWICPMGFLFQMLSGLRRWLPESGKMANRKFWFGHKYTLLITGFILSTLTALPVLGTVYLPAVFVRELHRFTTQITHLIWGAEEKLYIWITWGGIFIITALFIDLFLSIRWWCRYFCPAGALYSLLGRYRILRISKPESSCDNCGICDTVCPMGLQPSIGKTGQTCDNCHTCASTCHVSALHFRILPKWSDKS